MRWIVLGTLCLCMLMVAMDANILHTVMPTLIRVMRPTTIEQLWIVNAYALTLAGLLITMGALSDRHGRRRLLLWGLAVFGVASLMAGWIHQPWQAIACRGLLGIGGAMIMPNILSLIRNTFTDPRERTIALSACGVAGCVGAAVGPVLGGALVQVFNWQAAFLINVVVVLVAIPLVVTTVQESSSPGNRRWDWTSVGLSFVGMTALVQAIKLMGKSGWLSVEALALFAMGISSLAWFVRRQLATDDPLLDVRLFGLRSFSVGIFVYAMVMFALSSTIYLASQWLQFVYLLSPVDTGFWLLPATASALLGALAVPYCLQHWNVRDVMLAGMVCIAMTLFVPGMNGSGSLLLFSVSLAFLGAGVSLCLSSATTVVIMAAPAERAGSAAAVQSTAYEIGNVLGIAVIGSGAAAMYSHAVRLPEGIADSLAGSIRISVGEGVAAVASLPQETGVPLKKAVNLAFDHAFSTSSFVLGCMMLGAAMLTFVLLRDRPATEAERLT
ncbi:MFS transporter [Luteibacter sp.]|jgi:DHA2 family multidrug resistance protein-like MFS transporter|uniref:MFS transporter n=1 Tax=Luteibacter sp. TaxID=1886636 RepID=UPI002F3EB5F4